MKKLIGKIAVLSLLILPTANININGGGIDRENSKVLSIEDIKEAISINNGIAKAGGGVSVGYTTFQFTILQWDTSEWVEWFDNYISQQLLAVGSITTPVVSINVGKLLKNLWDGVKCLIPVWKGQLGFKIKLPTSLTIPLPCLSLTLDFTDDYRKVFNMINNTINSYISPKVRYCIQHPTKIECIKKGYNVMISKMENSQIEGASVIKYADMSNKEINQEVEKNAKSNGQPIMPIIGKKTVYNRVVLMSNIGAIKEAGSSYGKIVYPDRQIVKGLPEKVKREYAFLVKKQIYREIVLKSFQERIDALFQELATLKHSIDSFCEGSIFTFPAIPPLLGLSLGENINKSKIKELAKVDKKRCCCCDAIPSIHSAESHISGQLTQLETHLQTRITEAETAITTAIHQEGLQLRTLISTELYFTRVQLINTIQSLKSDLKELQCLSLKIEYQRNKILLLQMLENLALVEALYGKLNNDEYNKYKKLIKEAIEKLKE